MSKCCIVFESRHVFDDIVSVRGEFADVNDTTGVPVTHRVGNMSFIVFGLLSDERRKVYARSICVSCGGFAENPEHLRKAAIELEDYQSLSCFGHDLFGGDLWEICDNRKIETIFFNGLAYDAASFCNLVSEWEHQLRYEKNVVAPFSI